MRYGGYLVEFFDDFAKNCLAILVAIHIDKKAKFAVMLKNWCGFGAKLFKPGTEGGDVLVVFALATIV